MQCLLSFWCFWVLMHGLLQFNVILFLFLFNCCNLFYCSPVLNSHVVCSKYYGLIMWSLSILYCVQFVFWNKTIFNVACSPGLFGFVGVLFSLPFLRNFCDTSYVSQVNDCVGAHCCCLYISIRATWYSHLPIFTVLLWYTCTLFVRLSECLLTMTLIIYVSLIIVFV